MKNYISSTLLFIMSFSLCAQESFMSLNRNYMIRFEPELNKLDASFHTAFKPYRFSEVKKCMNADSVNNTFYTDPGKTRTLVGKKIRTESLLNIKTSDFSLEVDPLCNFEYGRDLISDTSVHVNTRGIQARGSIGEKFAFYTSFYENQATFVNYLDGYIRKNNVIPGQGFFKIFKNGQGFDYSMASGYISYTPSRYFNFQFGHDKNFIGDGYRSLLLSDNAFNYPFLKVTTNVWHFQYTNLYTSFLDIRNPLAFNNVGFDKKYATIHYLSWNICRRLNIGFFEAVVWRSEDSTKVRGYDVDYLNPVIFFRPVEFSLGSSDNALMGLTSKFKISDYNLFYGQLLLDEFKLNEVKGGKGWYANKQAFQLGLKSYNLFTVPNLNLQAEYNFVRPFTYSHYNTIQNYAHYNQPLAHPLGANFWEGLLFLNYRYKSFFAETRISYALYGADTVDSAGKYYSYGQNLYVPYTDHAVINPQDKDHGFFVGKGLQNTLAYVDFKVAYVINPKINLNIELGISTRTQNNSIQGTKKTNTIYLGLRTSLSNHYYDF